MVTHDTIPVTNMMIAFVCIGLVLIGGLLVMMRLRHKYHPNLIGALIGAMLGEGLDAPAPGGAGSNDARLRRDVPPHWG